jgi:beta-lactamase class A
MQTYNYYRPSTPIEPVKKRRTGRRIAMLGLVVSAVMIGSHFFGGNSLPLPKTSSDSRKVSASTIEPAGISPTQQAQMASQIIAAITAHPGMDIGVAIEDLNNGRAYHYGLSDPFIAASVGKLLTATLYLHQVEIGKQSLNKRLSYGTAGYELQQMIEQSDNTAWNDLATRLTHPGLKAYSTQIGLTNYDPWQNTLTADDISLLLAKLYKGELLNTQDTQLLLSYMHDANYDTYIPASVPGGVKVYHKAGWLSDRVHDAAIIDDGKHPYVLVIFTKDTNGKYDSTEGHQIFDSITQASVQAFIQGK